jgi:S1-C subfamily serine protease
MKLSEKIKKVKQSVIAIGFKPDPQRVTILGSGFSISNDGKILSVAHLYNQLRPDQISNLVGMAMDEQREKDDFGHYSWFPLNLIKKEDKDDIALFQLNGYKNTLLCPLDLDDSDKISVGDDAYFLGFPYAAQLMNAGFGITLIVNKTIVSNIKRDGRDPEHKRNFIILDAISNPGNSGCPLMNLETNKTIGVMSIAFRTKSKTDPKLDIREPMHICAARPINLAKPLLKNKIW